MRALLVIVGILDLVLAGMWLYIGGVAGIVLAVLLLAAAGYLIGTAAADD